MSTSINETRLLTISRTAQLSRLAGQVLEKKLAPLGITYQEFRIAGLLLGDNYTTQKDLAEKLNVRPATLSIAISKLSKRGIVSRIPSKTDRRVNYLRLRQSRKIAQVSRILYTLEQELTKGIGNKDLQTTNKVLCQIIENLATSTQTEQQS